jgi:hypothetical protein
MSKFVEKDPIHIVEEDNITPPPHYEEDGPPPILASGAAPVYRDLTDDDIRRLATRLREQDEADRPSRIWGVFIGALSGAVAVLGLQLVIGAIHTVSL